MVGECDFYMDDSGAREPDKKSRDQAFPDWFGFGGFLINDCDAQLAESLIENFRVRWPEVGEEAFRSYDIRSKNGRCRWLASVGAVPQNQFYEELTSLIAALPFHVLACVVDRPGYNKHYLEAYSPRRRRLCKTAFSVAVERAAKVALYWQSRLRVYVERSDLATERQFKQYYEEMRSQGLPFNAQNSAAYRPLEADALKNTLFEFRVKTKQSLLMQFADLVLWPVCKGGYDPTHVAYRALVENGKLIDICCTPENGLLGVKYSCFDR